MRIIIESERRIDLDFGGETLAVMYRPADGAEALQVQHGLQTSAAVEAVQRRLSDAQGVEEFDAASNEARELFTSVTNAVGDWQDFLLGVARAHLVRIGGILDGNGQPLKQEGRELADLLNVHARDLLHMAAVQIALDIVRAPSSGK